MGPSRHAHKRLVRALPRSQMVYPREPREKIKYAFWRAFTPVHPFFRELCMPVRRLRGRAKRQNFLLGRIAEGRRFEDLMAHLIQAGYRRHRVAWRDPEELVSLRLVVDFTWQYHLRIFSDGEIRGHFELTPESYPFKHLKKVHMEDRRDEFLELLNGWILPTDR